jgi:hypothetical protein
VISSAAIVAPGPAAGGAVEAARAHAAKDIAQAGIVTSCHRVRMFASDLSNAANVRSLTPGCRFSFVALYGDDLAAIQAVAFGGLAAGAAPAILDLLRARPIPVRRVVDVGCGAGSRPGL